MYVASTSFLEIPAPPSIQLHVSVWDSICFSNYAKLEYSATGFVSNSTQNALAFGPNETTRSDYRIFTHPKDSGGNLIHQMASSADFFFSTCQGILTRMLDVVPRNVKLTETISVFRFKPSISSMFIN